MKELAVAFLLGIAFSAPPGVVTAESIRRGCALGFSPACVNANRVATAGTPESAPPTLEDYPIILRGSKGPITERSRAALEALACRQGWPGTCQQRGR